MEKILVLDFGGQYNQLIARRVRDHHVYAEILPYTTPIETIKGNGYKGIIFTGGPNSVFDMSSPHYTKDILELGVPVLGKLPVDPKKAEAADAGEFYRVDNPELAAAVEVLKKI